MPPRSLSVSTKKYLAFGDLIRRLEELHYQRLPMVLEHGEFAVRGGIIDVFPSNHTHPLRFEYFGDELERLMTFNVQTQRSLSAIAETEIRDAQDKPKHRFLTPSIDTADGAILSEFREGDFVVHESYGIGRFAGLVHKQIGGIEGEYVFVQYKGEDKLYVPLNNLHLIQKYSGGDFEPRVNGLYDGYWKKVTAKVKKATIELAEELYQIYRARQMEQGFAFAEDTMWQIDLENSFEHKETPDQRRITDEIKADMESLKPMDRLVCGDVGYGKTEVLLRAAFKAINQYKQVAILVPTTILAEQHFKTISKRLKEFPFRIEMASRFNSPQKNKKILLDLKDGKVDLVIGTHRLLQKDVVFKDLGLLVVDEEHRFGVTHKEKIKQIKPNVDVLSLSATPIPRTLYMAFTGAKELSKMEHAPVKRKPILTYVGEKNDDIVREAIRNEVARGGQIYYVFNEVRHISQKYHALKTLFPDVSIAVGHGQMKETVLQDAMRAFVEKKAQIFLCSTIIESGVDVPNANTIVIERVDRFGLSQLHQLRGRVGRTERQAYAYLLFEREDWLSEKGKKRLESIREYAALGSGYKLAVKDLEIRGAGTLLGHKQHGNMTAVGFDLYCRILEDSVHRMRNEKTPDRRRPFQMKAGIKFYIPESYVAEPRERLAIYQRLMSVSHYHQLEDLGDELKDRYGKPPKLVEILFNAIALQVD